MVPLRGGTRLIRYLSTAESTHELPRMYAVDKYLVSLVVPRNGTVCP